LIILLDLEQILSISEKKKLGNKDMSAPPKKAEAAIALNREMA